MTRNRLLMFMLAGSMFCASAQAGGPIIGCSPPHPGTHAQLMASGTDAPTSSPLVKGNAAQSVQNGHTLVSMLIASSSSPQSGPIREDVQAGTQGGVPIPDGGNGENCQLLHGSDAVDWHQTTLISKSEGQGSGYLEAPLRRVAPGQALELRIELNLDEVATMSAVAPHAFVELDIDRGEERALLPVRVALQAQPDGAATLRLDGLNARLLQSGPTQDGAHDVRLRWQQVDAEHGEVSLLLNGQTLGTSALRGTPVAVRLGDLDLQGADTTHDYIDLRAATLNWQH